MPSLREKENEVTVAPLGRAGREHDLADGCFHESNISSRLNLSSSFFVTET